MSGRVYLDWNATAPLRPEAREAMIAALDVVGNPSSVHAEGRAAKGIVETARRQVAALVGCAADDVIFTSGATEAAAMVVSSSYAEFNVVCAGVEHDAVLTHRSNELALLVDGSGRLDLEPRFDEDVLGALSELSLIAVQSANSETGVMQHVPSAASYIKDRAPKMRVLSDIVQSCGKVAIAVDGVDFAIVSAHKLGGPKGVGAVIAKTTKERFEAQPLVPGGGQEMGRRSGTENVAGIAGFGAACEAAQRDLEAGVWDRVAELRNILEDALAADATHTILIGKDAPRLPNTSCFATPGWKGETQVMQMDLAGFAISAGSACSSGKVKESRVLRAMGYPSEVASSAIRVSLGPTTTEGEVRAFAEAWLTQHEKFRRRAA